MLWELEAILSFWFIVILHIHDAMSRFLSTSHYTTGMIQVPPKKIPYYVWKNVQNMVFFSAWMWNCMWMLILVDDNISFLSYNICANIKEQVLTIVW